MENTPNEQEVEGVSEEEMRRIMALYQEIQPTWGTDSSEDSALFVLYMTLASCETLVAWREAVLDHSFDVLVPYEAHLGRLTREGFLRLSGARYLPTPLAWKALGSIFTERDYRSVHSARALFDDPTDFAPGLSERDH